MYVIESEVIEFSADEPGTREAASLSQVLAWLCQSDATGPVSHSPASK